MDWLSFLIGVLVGWLICWLIDYVICRPRRMAAEAALRKQLERCNEESASLRTQLEAYQEAQARLDAANSEIAALKEQVARMKDLQADLVDWKARATEQALEIERLKAELQSGVSAAGVAALAEAAAVAPEAGAEVSAMGAPEVGVALVPPAESVKPDDLTLIEGIGPKISALLNQNGVYTFAQLAAASVEHLQSILSAAGPRFRLADPHTWPEQAALARDGMWDALQVLQDSLKAGRVV